MQANVTRKQLQAFVTVAKKQNFALAAKQMYLSQPALSITIKKLEQEIGGKLFYRTTRNLELTPEGLSFLPVAQRLLNDWLEAFDDLHQLFSMQRGKLTVAAMPSFASSLLPALVASFHRRYSNIKFSILDRVMEQVIEAVASGRAELGFTFEADNMQGVEFYPLFDDRFIVILPQEHELNQASRVSWRQLCNEPFVAMEASSAIRHWCDHFSVEAGVNLTHVAEASQLATVGQMVASGLGVSVVPALCQQQMLALGLSCQPLADTGLHKKVGIIKRKQMVLSTAASAFLHRVLEQEF